MAFGERRGVLGQGAVGKERSAGELEDVGRKGLDEGGEQVGERCVSGCAPPESKMVYVGR